MNRLGLVTVALVVVAGCTAGGDATATAACPAFEGWRSEGFPGDLSSAEDGPRYLAFLAELAASSSPVAGDAAIVHDASEQMHRIWMDDPEPSADELAALNGPRVLDAFQRILAHGDSACGVSLA